MKMNIFKYNIDHYHVFLRSCIMVYSNTCNLKSHYLQFSIKCNIRIADEQKNIAQMYAIDFYVLFKHFMLKLFH